MRAGDACPLRRRERLAGDAPQVTGAACSWHRSVGGDVVTQWPDPYRGWAQANGLASPGDQRAEVRLAGFDDARPDQRAAGSRAGTPAGLRVTHPADGTTFLIDPTLRAEFQAVPFRASGAGGDVSWTVNGRPVGSAGADAAVLWPLQRGRQVAVVHDARGRSAQVSFVVK